MTRTEQSHHNSARRPGPKRQRRSGWVSAVALTVVLATLSGCSWVPDYANPVEWYRGTRDWIMGTDEPQVAARRPQPAIPGANRPFPRISSVPGRPSPPSAAERRLAAGALVADRDRARYTDKIDRTRSAATAPVPPSAASRGFTPPALDRPPPPARAPPQTARAPEPLRPSPPSAAPPPPRISATASSTARRPPTAAGKPLQFAFGAPPADIRMSGAPAPSGSPVLAPLGAMAPFPPAGPGAAFADRRGGLGGTKVATILFNSGSSKLSRQGRRLVRSSWQAHRARGGVINVVGHASSRTKNLPPVRHQIANLNVSIDRANVVARELIRLGVRPENIQIDALSDSDPAFFEVMPAGESGNRRVEIHLRR